MGLDQGSAESGDLGQISHTERCSSKKPWRVKCGQGRRAHLGCWGHELRREGSVGSVPSSVFSELWTSKLIPSVVTFSLSSKLELPPVQRTCVPSSHLASPSLHFSVCVNNVTASLPLPHPRNLHHLCCAKSHCLILQAVPIVFGTSLCLSSYPFLLHPFQCQSSPYLCDSVLWTYIQMKLFLCSSLSLYWPARP